MATVVGVSVNPASAVSVTPGVDLGNFEVEGDMDVDDVAPPLLLDWAAPAVNGSAKFIPVIDDAGDSQFDGGMNEGNSGSWTCKTGNVNDKTDLLRAYVNQRIFNNHAFVDLAWVGNALNGGSSPQLSVSFEFNQLPLAQQPAVTIPGPCAITRQSGDLLITYAYTGGNTPVNIMLFRWNGSAWTDQSLTAANVRGANNTTAVPDLVANANGTVSIPAERFGEATIDLTAALTPPNGTPICAAFGTLNVRTQQNSNNDNSFSDRLPSSAIDVSTCASVTIEKKDDQGNPVPGAVFQAFKDDGDGVFEVPGDDAPAAGTCTTDALGSCSMGNLIPGNYFVRELSAPTGYTAATNVIGPIVLAAQQNVVIDGTTDLNTPPDGILDGFVNFRTQWQLTLVQDASNLVNTTHRFTATLTEKTSLVGNFGAADNETLTFTKSSGPGQITLVNNVAVGVPPFTCTTDSNGECTVTITSAVAGQTKVTATFLEQGVTVTTPVTKTAEATKNWVDYRLSISPDSVNRVGTAHTFEVLLETDTTGGSFVPAGTQTVNLTWTGSRTGMTINGVNAPAVGPLTCTTNSVTGKCIVVVNSAVTGLFTLDASYDAQVGVTSATINADEKTKRWIDWDLTITPQTDENLVNTQHTFTVRARFDAGSGAGLVGLQNVNPVVTLSPTGVGSIVTNNCATTGTNASGECTVIITSAVAGISTVNVTLNNTQQGVAVTLNAGPATKQWVAYRLSVEPLDVNRVNEQHEFTVFLETDTGSGFVPATGQTVDLSVVSTTGPAIVTINGISPPFTPPLTCVTGTGTTAGKCVVVVNSAVPGTFTLDASYAASVGNTSAVINADAATKRWIDWQLLIEPLEDTNLVGTNHTVTVTALFNDGDDSNGSVGFQPLVGVKPTVALTGIGSVVTDNCNGAGSTGTGANGKCTVITTSPIAGLSTLIASLTNTQDDITANLTAGPALKHWVAYTLTVTPNGVNRVNDTHEFTVLLQTNTGQGPVPVPGATVDLSVSGTSGTIVTINGDPAGAAPYSCTTESDGTCVVVVNSADTGELVLGASYAASAGQTSATIEANSATKRWIDWQMSISPPSDTNLINTNHTVTVRVLFDGGDGAGPMGLQGVKPVVTLTGVGSVVTNNCNGVGASGTGANGECTVVITSAVPGVSELSATLADTRDGVTANLTAGPARKQWVNYRITVTPKTATHLVGTSQQYLVTLEVARSPFVPAADEDIDLALAGVGRILAVDGTPVVGPNQSCTTDAAGHCTVTVTSDVVGTQHLAGTFHAVVGDTSGTFSDSAQKIWVAPPPAYGDDPGDTGDDDDPYGGDPGDTEDPSPFNPTTPTTPIQAVTPVDVPADVAGTTARPEPAPAVGGTQAEQQPAAPASPGGLGGLLPRTGAGIVGEALFALLLLGGGLALLRLARRRGSSPSA